MCKASPSMQILGAVPNNAHRHALIPALNNRTNTLLERTREKPSLRDSLCNLTFFFFCFGELLPLAHSTLARYLNFITKAKQGGIYE